MGCSGKALEHTLLSEEQGTDVDGEDGAFFAGTLLLELDVLGKEAERLGLILEDLKDTLTTGDNDDVKVLKFVVGVLRWMSAQVLCCSLVCLHRSPCPL